MASPTDFAATYAQMSDGELARVLRDERDLAAEAVSALNREIQKRNLDPSELRKQKPHSIDEPRRLTIAEKRLKGKRIPLPWLLATLPLFVVLLFFLYHFGVEQLYWPICITIFVPIFVVWGFWELKGRPWFWATVTAITAANIAIFGLVGWPWGEHWAPGRAIAGLCTLELIPIFALIARLQKRMSRNRQDQLNPPISTPHASPAGKIDTNPT